ncbi:MAG: response regulator transcription factor [Clostridia bacterium]|nr:response regulator transcription factor [Clostridia bacterium]
MRILVVEDEPSLNALIVKKLTMERYSVDACLNGTDARDYMACAEYDVILLDIMLPGMSGLELLRELRRRNDKTPVLLLTAKDGVQDRVEGLDCGADDYLVKPFSFDELLARIRVILRRGSDNMDHIFTLADLKVDCKAHTVSRGGVPIALSSKEYSILEYLVRNRGTVLSRERISNHIWNYEYEGGSNVVDVYIRYLRRKLDDGFSPKLIHTVRGAGYVLREEP